MLKIGLKHTIFYIFGILSSIFFVSMASIQPYQLNQSASFNISINKKEKKVEINKSSENDSGHCYSQSPAGNKQNTYRRCYQANSLIQEVNVLTLMHYTRLSDIQSGISNQIESYFSRTRNIEISLPIPVLVYPFNYFW